MQRSKTKRLRAVIELDAETLELTAIFAVADSDQENARVCDVIEDRFERETA